MITLKYFSPQPLLAPDHTEHPPHLEDQSHLAESGEDESKVVFLNVTAVRPGQAVLPPLINPPVSSLLPDGLYQPPGLPTIHYDDYDNKIDDGNSTLYTVLTTSPLCPSLLFFFFCV